MAYVHAKDKIVALLVWSSKYETGNSEVDESYRLLVERVNDIAAQRSDHKKDELIQSLAKLYVMMADRAHSAETANRAKSRHLANISHEIRSPLGAVIGLTHLAECEATSETQRQLLKQSSHSAHHLMQIINDVLDLAKIESDKFIIRQTDFHLDQVIDSAIAIVRQQAESKGLNLSVFIDPALHGPFVGDAVRIRQMLLNYLINAAKFTARGAITCRATCVAESNSSVTLRIEVDDTGKGIKRAELARLFQPFEQAAPGIEFNAGTGLGLAITRRLAELMGGTTGARSRPGFGSTFWFSIELARGRQGAKRESVSLPVDSEVLTLLKASYANARLLVVEDDPINRAVMIAFLRKVFRRTEFAQDGAQAVELAQDNKFDLILMNIQLPKLNGLEASKIIRGQPLHANTPIVAITANVFEEDKQACLDAGMTDFLSKPVSHDLLFSTLLRGLISAQAQTDAQLASFQRNRPASHPEQPQSGSY